MYEVTIIYHNYYHQQPTFNTYEILCMVSWCSVFMRTAPVRSHTM